MFKKITTLLLLVALILTCFSATASAETVIEISTKQQLNDIRLDKKAHYKLVNDIVFTEDDFKAGGAFYNNAYGWEPIGKTITGAFEGVFDGNGYTIKGLTSLRASCNYMGLFGVNKGTIKNVKIENAYSDATYGINIPVSGGSGSGKIDYSDKDVWTKPIGGEGEEDLSVYDFTGESTARTGILCGYNIGSISNCSTTGYVKANDCAGGLVARNSGVIMSCYSCVYVVGRDLAGGLVGTNVNFGDISNCYTRSFVKSDTAAGGLIGENNASKLRQSHSLAYVKAPSQAAVAAKYVGGSVSNVYYLDGVGQTDTKATAATTEDLSQLAFNNDYWTNRDGDRYLTALGSTLGQRPCPNGDIDASYSVDITDLAILKKFLSNPDDPSLSGSVIYIDCDNSGSTDITDLAKLKKYLAGIELLDSVN